MSVNTISYCSWKINIIERDGAKREGKKHGRVAEVGIRGPFIVNLIKRKLLSSALSRLGGWVGVLFCAELVEFHILDVQGEETRRNALKLPSDKERGGTGDTVAQYYSYSHSQYACICIALLRRSSPNLSDENFIFSYVKLSRRFSRDLRKWKRDTIAWAREIIGWNIKST